MLTSTSGSKAYTRTAQFSEVLYISIEIDAVVEAFDRCQTLQGRRTFSHPLNGSQEFDAFNHENNRPVLNPLQHLLIEICHRL